MNDGPITEPLESLVQQAISAAPEAHVFVRIDQGDLPVISLDLANEHGRRSLGIRVNGMSIAGVLVDVAELPPTGKRIRRFCPYCGTKRDLFSSSDRHDCEDEGW